MRQLRNKILVTFLGLQVLLIGPIIADSVTGTGNEEVSQNQTALVIDSLHTQEPPGIAEAETMIASYYYGRFHGRKTASGERYDQHALTCAHKTLPFQTILHVTNPSNGKSVIVRVNDRGPFKKGRDLDLSYAAAEEIGMLKKGVSPVEVVLISPDQSNPNDSLVRR